jgi:hypothetical protein
VYVLTLAGLPADVIDVTGTVRQASYSSSGACFVKWTGVSLTAGTVTLLVVTAAGAAVEPTTSDVITITVKTQTYTPPV